MQTGGKPSECHFADRFLLHNIDFSILIFVGSRRWAKDIFQGHWLAEEFGFIFSSHSYMRWSPCGWIEHAQDVRVQDFPFFSATLLSFCLSTTIKLFDYLMNFSRFQKKNNTNLPKLFDTLGIHTVNMRFTYIRRKHQKPISNILPKCMSLLGFINLFAQTRHNPNPSPFFFQWLFREKEGRWDMFCTLSELDDIAGTWFARAGQRCQSFVRYEFLLELGSRGTCQKFVSKLHQNFVQRVFPLN